MYLSNMELYHLRATSPGKFKVVKKVDELTRDILDNDIGYVKGKLISYGYLIHNNNDDVLIDYTHDIFREGNEEVCDVIETYKLSVKLKEFIDGDI